MTSGSSAAPTAADDKRATIRAAAIEVFAEQGFAATSMAKIAERASMSRPALYLYFSNKEDVFRSTLDDAFATAIDSALAELDKPGRVVDQLDGFLQRYHGDLKALVLATPHGDELLAIKAQHGADIAAAARKRASKGLGHFLATVARTGQTTGNAQGEQWLHWRELLETAPMGFMTDGPSLAVFRRRLRTLAEAVAAGLAVTPRETNMLRGARHRATTSATPTPS